MGELREGEGELRGGDGEEGVRERVCSKFHCISTQVL